MSESVLDMHPPRAGGRIEGAGRNGAGAATVEVTCPSQSGERTAAPTGAGAAAVESALSAPAGERIDAPPIGERPGAPRRSKPPYSFQPRSGSIAAAAIGW